MTGAYSFVCSYGDTHALCARLNAMGGWTWHLGDSHWYGDYVACKPFEDVRIRIVDFPRRGPNEGEWRYEADIKGLWSPDGGARAATIDAAFRKVLHAIPAHDVTEIEWFD